jgi:hypothetical protein
LEVSELEFVLLGIALVLQRLWKSGTCGARASRAASVAAIQVKNDHTVRPNAAIEKTDFNTGVGSIILSVLDDTISIRRTRAPYERKMSLSWNSWASALLCDHLGTNAAWHDDDADGTACGNEGRHPTL